MIIALPLASARPGGHRGDEGRPARHHRKADGPQRPRMQGNGPRRQGNRICFWRSGISGTTTFCTTTPSKCSARACWANCITSAPNGTAPICPARTVGSSRCPRKPSPTIRKPMSLQEKLDGLNEEIEELKEKEAKAEDGQGEERPAKQVQGRRSENSATRGADEGCRRCEKISATRICSLKDAAGKPDLRPAGHRGTHSLAALGPHRRRA